MSTSVIGFPRVGSQRELKFATEKFLRGELTADGLQDTARVLRKEHWLRQKSAGVHYIPSNDFSFYDTLLDTAFLLNIIPVRYRKLGLDALGTYFAMARGYQGEHGDVRALAMKKWFNTNYHYIVPEFEDGMEVKLAGEKPFAEYREAKGLGIETKPVLVGPYTLLKLLRFTGQSRAQDIAPQLTAAYGELLRRLEGTAWIQFDEPSLVLDMSEQDLVLYTQLYHEILAQKGGVKVLLQTYFGDIRDCYEQTIKLPFDGIGLDFVEGRKTGELIRQHGFPQDKQLFAGVVNGKNIWKNCYARTLDQVSEVLSSIPSLVIGTSCSLLHVPYTLEGETALDSHEKQYLSFAYEKLQELTDLAEILDSGTPEAHPLYAANALIFHQQRTKEDAAVQARTRDLRDSDFTRLPNFAQREAIQKKTLGLPLLPTTTIGSFPQPADVRANRLAYRKGELTQDQYHAFNRSKIKDCVRRQEEIGLDVLVHGEFERNDMVEYFGENLEGFLFTQKAWVQSYGTRCVKPPIIWGDVARKSAITVSYSVFAQSCTERPVKGMLTGPVTILNWSFPREDISLRDATVQIALAIRDEVLDLERNGISIIQVDEAALREKLPLRQSDWHSEYLDWAIPAFRLVHSGVRPETQIHTHMCYSEFTDIITDIDAMDADVITFEASRSDLLIIDALKTAGFQTEVGPGVYDIHSPRIPSAEEIEQALTLILAKLPAEKLWVNPDCGLKTRGEAETWKSLETLVGAAKNSREKCAL